MSDAIHLIRVDMHTHTESSPDCETPIEEQALAIQAIGLDVVCATDHNTIEGALHLREIANGFRVIVGEEISSRDGEIIGLFLTDVVARDLSGQGTIAQIREQGGLVVVPHPFSHNRPDHIRSYALDRLWPQIDAIEIFNAREAFAADNQKAANYARDRRLPGTAGSDAHRAADVGRAFVEMPDFSDSTEFLASLREGVVHGALVSTRLSPYDRARRWLLRRNSGGAS
jgi:predicted metal-dependent phosphoesterase TrpH